MKVWPSALKHGVSSEDAIQAAEWSLRMEPLDENGPPDRELRLGFETRARLLETVVLVFEAGDETVIQAMPVRKKYFDLLPLSPRSAPGPPVDGPDRNVANCC